MRATSILTDSGIGYTAKDLSTVLPICEESLRESKSKLPMPTYRAWFSIPPKGAGSFTRWTLVEAGFPFPAFRASSWQFENLTDDTEGAIQVAPANIVTSNDQFDLPPGMVPMTPMWKGVICNTLIYTCGWLLLLSSPASFRALRSRRRIKRGLCIRCGYDLHSGTGGPCPECGFVSPPTLPAS